MELELYDYWRSGAAYRVRIGLNLKGLSYTSHPVDLRTGAQLSTAYMRLNPQGLAPTLIVDGRPLTQSVAILEFLDEVQPASPLLPVEPFARARVRALCAVIAADTHPLHNLRVGQALRSDFGADEARLAAWNRRWIEGALQVLEPAVTQLDRGWSAGDEPGLLDCLLVPLLYSARRFGAELAAYPRLLQIDAQAAAHPAFAAAHPDRQPDAPS